MSDWERRRHCWSADVLLCLWLYGPSLWREFLGTFILYKQKTILVSDQRLKLDSSDIYWVIDSYQPSSKTKWSSHCPTRSQGNPMCRKWSNWGRVVQAISAERHEALDCRMCLAVVTIMGEMWSRRPVWSKENNFSKKIKKGNWESKVQNHVEGELYASVCPAQGQI